MIYISNKYMTDKCGIGGGGIFKKIVFLELDFYISTMKVLYLH